VTYFVVGGCLCLVGLVLADVLATGWVAGVVATFGSRLRGGEPFERRRLFGALRVLPFAMAALFTLFVLAPSYVRFEPPDASESVGFTLGLACLLALLVVLWGPLRALRSWLLARRLETAWLWDGERVDIPSLAVPVWRVRDGGVGLWVSGLLRPRLILGEAAADALTPAELGAALRHELAHVTGRDNLFRLSLAGWPGALSLMPLGRRLEREWSRATEAAADRRAVGDSSGAAVDLASALIKVARLGGGLEPNLATSALGEGDIEERVRALLADHPPSPTPRLFRLAAWCALLLPLFAIVVFTLAPGLVAMLHEAGEHLVRRF
jgi:hypothetical protein